MNLSTLILSVNDSLICWGWWSSICATFVQTSEENEQALYSYFSSLSSLLYNRTARYQIRLDFQIQSQNSRSIFIHIVLFYFLLLVLILTLAVKKRGIHEQKRQNFVHVFLRRSQIVKPKREIEPNFCGPLRMYNLYFK